MCRLAKTEYKEMGFCAGNEKDLVEVVKRYSTTPIKILSAVEIELPERIKYPEGVEELRVKTGLNCVEYANSLEVRDMGSILGLYIYTGSRTLKGSTRSGDFVLVANYITGYKAPPGTKSLLQGSKKVRLSK